MDFYFLAVVVKSTVLSLGRKCNSWTRTFEGLRYASAARTNSSIYCLFSSLYNNVLLMVSVNSTALEHGYLTFITLDLALSPQFLVDDNLLFEASVVAEHATSSSS